MRAGPLLGQAGGVRTPPALQAGARLGTGLAGALLVVLAAVPLGLLVRSAWSPLASLDRAASADAERAVDGSAAVLAAARVTTHLGDPVLMTVLAVVLAVVLLRRGYGRLALFVVASRVGALVLSQGLKAAYDRTRPLFEDPVATALGSSFPSGHALGATAFWTSLAVLVRPWVRRERLVLAGAIAVALVVAASRVLLGVHYLSDVTAGLLIGGGWTAVCTAVLVAERSDAGRPVDVATEGVGT